LLTDSATNLDPLGRLRKTQHRNRDRIE